MSIQPNFSGDLAMFRIGLQLIVLALVLLTGCTGQPPAPNQADSGDKLQPFDQVYTRFQTRNLDNVRADLIALKPNVTNEMTQTYWHLLNAWYSLLGQDPNRSLLWLSKSSSQAYQQLKLQESWRPNWIQAEALALNNEFLSSAKIRMYLTGAFQDEWQEQQNQDILWLLLLALPEETLNQLTEKPLPSLLKGWYQLAALHKSPNTSLASQRFALQRWLNRYPDHPAAKRLPTQLQQLMALETALPENIAVLLPLSGALATTAEAIRNGLLYAYYQNAEQDNPPSLRFYDTQGQSLVQIYKQALDDGANLIIGPLKKEHVQHIQTAAKLPSPTLALNYGERDKADNPTNLYQYGLAAEDEARAVAIKAWQDGHRVAGVLMPEGAWGDRVFTAFAQTWHALGGKLAETQAYRNDKELNPKIQQLLNVVDSQYRAKRIRNIIGESIQFDTHRRQDLDIIFTAALPQDAKQIKPLLAYHFAGDIPLYATSTVNDVAHSSSAGRDLNGVIVSDIPWVIHQPKDVSDIQTIWSNANRGYLRLYAMGYDAFKIGTQIHYLKNLSNARIYGATGALQLDSFGQIQRLPEFAQFHAGRLRPLQAPSYELFTEDQGTTIRLIGRESSEALPTEPGTDMP
jgi:outer membrane PBP1 activator LpoA protein